MVFNKEPMIGYYTLKKEQYCFSGKNVVKTKTLGYFMPEDILPEKEVMQRMHDGIYISKREAEMSIEMAIMTRDIRRDGKFLKRINRS